MAAKKGESSGVRYVVVRDVTLPGAGEGDQGRIALAGETVELAEDDAALLVRDGFLRAEV